MTDWAIRATGLGKRYRLGQDAPYGALRDSLAAGARALGTSLRRRLAGGGDGIGSESPSGGGRRAELWALRDVDFTLRPGSVVGLIGRNGAGKSTLLKLLARITPPTEGEAWLRGRVGALLEVGTGFHPELTGRENIYLAAAIMGMRRSDVRLRFDRIVEFAGVEAFLDTPVKRYSSGMHTRLAFAVAAHLEPEILLVDEVLAVGDARFQRKCLGRMDEVAREGRTVVFVSHAMTSVTRLCPQAMLLEGGRLVAQGPTGEVVARYLRGDVGSQAAIDWPDPATAPGDSVARLRSVSVRQAEAAARGEGRDLPAGSVDIRLPVEVALDYDILAGGHRPLANLHFFNESGTCLFISVETPDGDEGDGDGNEGGTEPSRGPGSYRAVLHIPGNFLAEGQVIVDAALSTLDPVSVHAHVREAVAFEVMDSLDGGSVRGAYGGEYPGVVRPALPWRTRRTEAV